MKRSQEENDLRRIELLAPAGTPEAGYAALHYGADAVYLGLEKFSARAAAGNFSSAALADITGYAHSRPQRRNIYLAVNTLVLQNELGAVIDLLAEVAALGVDAVIVQDLGIVHVLRKYFPQLKIHASTQMAIHNRAGVETVAALGIKRVTLARELTLAELAEIAALKKIEIEVFIHGALCYAYSGLCLFSSHLYGRSGNRGQCAYPCREWFEPGGFIFSMKDLALPEYVLELRRLGVTALKIEGRMKSPLYVAAAVNYYRKLLDGALSADAEQQLAGDLKTIFSRPWTDLYLKSRKNRAVIDRAIVGHRGRPAGQVGQIIKSARGHSLRFQTALPLELHDGLQIDLQGLPRPFGFAVRNIFRPGSRRNMKRVFTAPAGALVEIPLPPDHPLIPPGAIIYCASSQKVKRDYAYFQPKTGQYRVRQTADFEIRIEAKGFEVIATANVLLNRNADIFCRAAACGAPPAGRWQAEALPHSGSQETPISIEAKKHFAVALSPAQDVKQVGATIEKTFRKLGNTGLQFGKIEIANPENCFVPVSVLNAARRDVAAELERQISELPRKYATTIKSEIISDVIPDPTQCVENSSQGGRACCPPRTAECRPSHRTVFGGSPRRSGEFRWSLKTDQPRIFNSFTENDRHNLDEIIIELSAANVFPLIAEIARLALSLNREKIRLALPVILRAWEIFPLTGTVAGLIAQGWRKWQIANLGGLALLRAQAKNSALDISADWPVYALNAAAVAELRALGIGNFTLSPEDGLENMGALLRACSAAATVIVYQDTPLMISENCVFSGDEAAEDQVLFSGAHGNKIQVVKRADRSFVLNRRPFCLAAHLNELAAAGARALRVDFVYRQYSAPEALAIWRQVRSGRLAPMTHAANYGRGLA